MLVVNPETGAIVRANKAAELFYGYPPGTLQLMNIDEINTLSRTEISAAMEAAFRENLMCFEFPHRLSSGEIRSVEVHSSRIDLEDGSFLFSIIHDITDRKRRAEEALRVSELKCSERLNNLNAELEQRVALRTEELLEANRNMESFSYSVSHDLRAPLRAIDGYLSILAEELNPKLSGEFGFYIDKISQNARKMGVLIDDLLAFARMSRHVIEKQTVFPALLVYDALAVLERERKDRQLDIRVGDLPQCLADPTLLRQVFVNLLSNAFKFSRNSAPALIEVGSVVKNDETVYFVRDNGVGFDMRYMDKLFGVFQRLHASSDFEGTGVGLAIVQKIVQRHGGRVWAEGAVGEGATFYFTLTS